MRPSAAWRTLTTVGPAWRKESTVEVEEVDLLVIGGGKAGKSLAMDRARAGWDVVMVERDKIGGTCINVACIPTKSLVESARALLSARQAGDLGVAVVRRPEVDLDRLRAHKEGVVAGMVDAHTRMFADAGMDFVLGTARFVAPRTVEVTARDGGRRTVRARDVVVNTGTAPALPDLPGITEAGVLTSESILRLARVPGSLLVLGGGYVGCEFAAMFTAFGTRVTLLQGGPQLLAREDPDVAADVARVLTDQGVDVRLGSRAEAVRRDGPEVVLTLADGTEVRGDDLLVATGRVPVTDDLAADAAGVRLDDRGFVVVDDHLRTSAEHVWAAGDVAGSPQFTHASWHDFRILRANLTGGEATTTGRLVPYTVFVTPELARVGLTETQARERGLDVAVARLPVAAIPRAKTVHDTVGTWKAVVDRATDRILGVALLGLGSGEVVTAVQLAMLGGLTWPEVRDAVITHPTMGEGLNLLFDTLGWNGSEG
ncbi:MAG TPA: FAD-dependent oxidoreductase [Actinomycetaceae bacterium]|nr:FAD-dependent oxidoreductase [Actinomycetaceae bacterium]